MRYKDEVSAIMDTGERVKCPANVSWTESIFNAASSIFLTEARLRITAPPDSPLTRLKLGDTSVEWDGRDWYLQGEPRITAINGKPHHVTLDIIKRG